MLAPSLSAVCLLCLSLIAGLLLARGLQMLLKRLVVVEWRGGSRMATLVLAATIAFCLATRLLPAVHAEWGWVFPVLLVNALILISTETGRVSFRLTLLFIPLVLLAAMARYYLPLAFWQQNGIIFIALGCVLAVIHGLIIRLWPRL